MPVSATDADADADALKYSATLTGSGKGTAAIQSPTGEADLTNGKGDIRIQASDSTGTSATVTVTVTDGVEPATETFALTFEADDTPTFGSETQADLSFTKDTAITTVTLPAATGGNGTVAYALVTADGTRTPATLPAGLTFDAATRQIRGTPTAVAASSTYRYQAEDDDVSNVYLDFDIEVVEPVGKALVLSTTSLRLFEDGTATFTVRLSEAPDAGVNVTLASGATGTATVPSATLSFTTSNWNTAQTVTVTGVDDDLDNTGNKRDATITLSAANADSNDDSGYDGKTAIVTAQVVDDEHPTLNNAFWSGTMAVGESGGETGFKAGASGHGLLMSGQFDYPGCCHYHILDRLIPFSAPSGPVWPWHGFPRR